MNRAKEIIEQEDFSRKNLAYLLEATGGERSVIFEKAADVKQEYVENKVYFRGLIEFSNICAKDCFYCGIRRHNRKVDRYYLSGKEVLEAARFAWKEGYGSLLIQSGERKVVYGAYYTITGTN